MCVWFDIVHDCVVGVCIVCVVWCGDQCAMCEHFLVIVCVGVLAKMRNVGGK